MTRIAIATDNGTVSPHFGHCSGYTLAQMEDGRLVAKTFVANPGHEPGLLPRLLAGHDVQLVIAGGIGQRAQMLFSQQGIDCITGVTGPVDAVLAALMAGKLAGGASLCDHDNTDQSGPSHQCRGREGTSDCANGGR